ncbi:transglycosylase domain-containing protein [Ahrensia kielensis]|uniref:transglycosylase domain-containing protein n=1 Tax=Ahrensia kielensis TaxID=76980 RepID=UPI00036B683E|nr:transglycosylase domain-containing protein [Ahrensia kielensis]
MIFRKKPKQRVEPRFADRPSKKAAADFAVTEDDRAAPPPKKRAKKTTARKAPAKSGPQRRSNKRSSKSKKQNRGRGLIGGLFYWSFILCIWGGIGVAGIFAYYGAQMPSASTWEIPDRPPNVKIVSVNGKLVANRGTTGGAAVGLHDMSPYIPQAIIAIEDRRYYSHFGFDPIGFGRAMMRNVMSGRLVQGGSTITQQLAKNLFLSPERTMGRKVQELVLALWLEQKYSKSQILEMYLNRVYFGSGSYGVEAASRRYFSKTARDVSLPEAALLAGLVKAPSRLSPAKNPQAAEERAQVVLSAMRAQGMVSDSEMTAALSGPTTKAAAYWTGSENYVADHVMDQVQALVGEIKQDVIVDTTVDLSLQKFGEEAIRELIAQNGEKSNVSQGALVSIDGTGAVRAMIGGYDYANSQFDRASEAKRQPGSSFKPFVFLAALENGMTPNSIRNDAPIKIGKWTPENYNGKYYGEVTLTTALSKSLNSVAAQLIMENGAGNVAKTAHRMGIASKLEANASLSLGTSEVTLLELTSAYTPFATGGYRAKPHMVQRITTMDGAILYEHIPQSARVISADVAGMMNAMMSQTVEKGTARGAKFDHPAAGKTGTSQSNRDAWFIGYTRNLTTGVWFGNDDGAPMKGITGGGLPVKAWHSFMVKAHEGVPVSDLPGYQPITIVPQQRPNDLMVQRPTAPVGNSNAASLEQQVLDNRVTASNPRPKVGVGENGTSNGKPRSLVDIILGR